MAGDFLVVVQPAVGLERGGRGADGGDPFSSFALTNKPLFDQRAFAQAFRPLGPAGKDDDLEFAHGIDVGKMDVGEVPGLTRGGDRIGGEAGNEGFDFGAPQDVDGGDGFDFLKAGGEKDKGAHDRLNFDGITELTEFPNYGIDGSEPKKENDGLFMLKSVKTKSARANIENLSMKTIRTNRGWWLITPENAEQEAALEEFLNTFKCCPELAPATKLSREADLHKPVAPVLQPR